MFFIFFRYLSFFGFQDRKIGKNKKDMKIGRHEEWKQEEWKTENIEDRKTGSIKDLKTGRQKILKTGKQKDRKY